MDTDNHWPSKTGSIISTSRSYSFAREWAKEKSLYAVVIELDRGKLKTNYKIVPFNYFGSKLADSAPKARWMPRERFSGDVDRNQFEEAITKDIKQALRYIKRVYLSKSAIELLKQNYNNEYSVLVRHELIRIMN